MFLLGAGIALLNVLMPVVIKTRWSRRIGMLMGLYTGMIGLSGAVGGLTAAPLFAWGGSLSWPLWFLDRGSPAGADGLAAPDAVQDARTVKRIAVLCTKASGG